MLHAFFRAATLALLAAVAVLVYINYFHSSGPQADLSTEAAVVNSPPELPKLAPNPEPQLFDGLPPMAENAPLDSADRTRNHSRSDAMPLAEVVELPSTPRRRPAPVIESQLAQAPTGRRTHVVQSGESLWVISKKYFGNAEQLTKIAECNNITSRDRIRAGQILVIPDLSGGSAQHVAQGHSAVNALIANAPAIVRPALISLEADADHEETRAVPVSHNRAPVMSTQATRKH